jgi:Secretion system C-terminal sorting domain/Chlamydia polymorphic membrane protein (Chlamydia_PMP) repeat
LEYHFSTAFSKLIFNLQNHIIMKSQHLLLTAMFLFTINVFNAQSIKKQTLQRIKTQDIHQEKERSLKKIGLGQNLLLSETAVAMQKETPPQIINPPPANLVMATIYVKSDATGINDGTSWDDAFTDLQDALASAPLGDQVWVAAGTYFPGAADSSTFLLNYDLELYGGFTGTESSIDERDIENNPTILSGDLSNNDVDDDFETNREDNVLNVMRIENTVTTATVIDGFTIQGGQADGDTLIFTEVRGAGVMSFGAAQFYNCIFRQNYATYYGGGLYFRDEFSADGKVVNCRFEKNESGIGGGGMVAGFASGEGIEVEGSQFQGNHADFGAGLYFVSVNGTMNNCEFTGNIADNAAGGIYFGSSGTDHSMGITASSFENNESTQGGAIAFESTGTNIQMTITGSDFLNNHASEINPDFTRAGGAIFNIPQAGSSNSSVIVEDCTFDNNTTEYDGGAITNYLFGTNDSIEINNCIFTENSSQEYAGALSNWLDGANGTVETNNCTFTGNSSLDYGGAVVNWVTTDNTTSSISNCSFENNEATLGGGVYYLTSGENNHNSVTGCDFQNNNVSPFSTNTPRGGAIRHWFDPEAINCSTLVDDCTFTNNVSAQDGGAIANFIQNGGHFCAVTNSAFTENRAIGLGWGGAIYSGDVGNNDTLNIENCVFSLNTSDNVGGGIQEQTTGTFHQSILKNCEFLNNHADEFGGGYRVQSEDSKFQLLVEDCLFDGNSAFVDGGGFEVAQFNGADCDMEIRNTEFLNNTSGNEGAGFNFYTEDISTANILIENVHFDSNENDNSGNAEEGAGGFSLNNFGNGIVEIDIKSSIFENNVSEDGAGAIQLYKIGTDDNDVVTIENSLLSNNSGGDYAGGIGLEGSIDLSVKSTTIADNTNGGISINDGSLELQNTILYNPGSDDFISTGESGANSLGGNLVGDTTMNGTLNGTDIENEDPLFVGSGDYQLTENSPAVDKGILTDDVAEFDLEGNDRVNGCLDIGAFESPYLVSNDCITATKEILVENSGLNIYPNPITNLVNIQLENDWSGELQVQIVNLLGQKVYSVKIDKAFYEGDWSINTNHLSNGIYQLIISNGKEMMVETLSKL